MNNLNEKKLELVGQILTQAIEISTNSIIDVFVDFASHVNSLYVRVYLDGWNFEDKPNFNDYVRLDSNDCIEKLNYIKEYLSKIRKV